MYFFKIIFAVSVHAKKAKERPCPVDPQYPRERDRQACSQPGKEILKKAAKDQKGDR
jgi:hypothetical protein